MDKLDVYDNAQTDFYQTPEHRERCRTNILGNVEQGEPISKSQKVVMKQLPSKVKALRFRELEVIELIDDLLDTSE